MIYGYARVSSKEQHLDRQLEELKKHVKPIYIYILIGNQEKTLNVQATKK